MKECRKIKYDRVGAWMKLTDIEMLRVVKNYKHRREIKVYRCPMCRYWHLTSWESRHQKVK